MNLERMLAFNKMEGQVSITTEYQQKSMVKHYVFLYIFASINITLFVSQNLVLVSHFYSFVSSES